MKWIKIKVEHIDHAGIKLTRLNGDTFTSTAQKLNEELSDFFHSPDESSPSVSGEEIDKDKRIEALEDGLAVMIKEYEYAMRLMAEATGVVYSENNVAISAKHLLTNK